VGVGVHADRPVLAYLVRVLIYTLHEIG
jgi:hypothetical protein